MAVPAAVGVDVGGTWIRIKGLDARGRCVWSLKKPSPSIAKLPAFLKKCLRQFHEELPSLAIGSRGVWKQSKRRNLKRALKGLAKRIVVMSDVEAAWLAAFGKNGTGVIVIAGTGSIAYGRRADGTFARAGGLGPEKGDEGSGHWIAKEWLVRTGQDRMASKPVRNIAAVAPKILSLARHNDPLASAIVEQAQLELAMLVRTLAVRLHFKTIPVSWAGSVLNDDWFCQGFFSALLPLSLIRASVKTDAATALAKSIISHASR